MTAKLPKRLRITKGFGSLGGPRPSIDVSLEHGYLWIGPKAGPCLVYISGKKTLHKIARMILRDAR